MPLWGAELNLKNTMFNQFFQEYTGCKIFLKYIVGLTQPLRENDVSVMSRAVSRGLADQQRETAWSRERQNGLAEPNSDTEPCRFN